MFFKKNLYTKIPFLFCSFKGLLGVLLISLIALPLYAAQNLQEVNLYSARKEALIKPIIDDFSEQTGIKVNLITGKADALLQRIKSEGKNTHADVFITTDAVRLYRAKSAGVLQTINSDALNNAIPDNLRDPEGYWYGLSMRARPIFYVKDSVDPNDLSTYEALADSQFKGRICIRSSNNIYNQSLLASMLAADGNDKAQQWTNDFVKNFARKPKVGDRDQIKGAASGQCDIAIANTYYYGKMLTGKKADQKKAAEAVAIFWPNQGDRGTHVNVSGAGVTKYAKNTANAQKLIEFLATKKAQRWYADVNFEYPVRKDVAASELLKNWGEFKADTINLNQLGANNAQAVKIMDRAGWK
ncbi:MAG: Fe(3+) ABC transporter substrate-binding protein [gamma proteobacterium symbiont of Bathyaustriella thionipta]|nr:Fe(3+) ABC transporter substrate-binding protein [gamma proteobacterium symbiont of Bathyaustriella thionipta]MCU7948468.1 Fe(3+) ABC transporter substrate-binding protein [gamma proteobacterium symbiont of Bathyaustriella thionipta]MCU7952464.1 Fe(3+) ABC transporter substrate-binding protein [gamma proteobacterium symbiont of Bathyaustriella thionipta]MCU7955390.1 Fe(3+) ABC transporter substrate-binding protein [gamma proteobacterium symbiont of Bathyaustriella thionipta]MCU7967934.1 Fe(3